MASGTTEADLDASEAPLVAGSVTGDESTGGNDAVVVTGLVDGAGVGGTVSVWTLSGSWTAVTAPQPEPEPEHDDRGCRHQHPTPTRLPPASVEEAPRGRPPDRNGPRPPPPVRAT